MHIINVRTYLARHFPPRSLLIRLLACHCECHNMAKNTSPDTQAKTESHFRTELTVCQRARKKGEKKERNGTGECLRQRQRDGHREGDGDREIRELGTEEEPTINEFPGEEEGHGEITEQKEKTEMTFLKGLLCGICRKKNEM